METRTGINCLILATTNLSVYLCTMVNMNVTVIFQIAGGGHKSRQADRVPHV